jgi:FkbM family methyltransferase
MRIFLDVGGYKGHSSLAALDPIFGFDRVFCFEPVTKLAREIRKIKDRRLVVIEAALSDYEGEATIHHAGTLAGSLSADAPSYQDEGETCSVQVVRAAAFLRSIISEGDFVRAKFNCEGAEVDIIHNLVEGWDSKKVSQVLTQALIDFDANKIPSKRERTAIVEKELAELSVKYLTPPECQYGMVTNYGGIRNYLLKSGARLNGLWPKVRSLFYNARMSLNPELNGYHKLRLLKLAPFMKAVARSRAAESL